MKKVVIVRKHLLAVLAVVVTVVDVVQFGVGEVDLSIWYVQSQTCSD